jgi:hypothetical protein
LIISTRRRASFFAIALALLAVPSASTQRGPILQEPQAFRLWEGRAPGALGDADADIPTLTVYMPSNTTGPMTAVVIAPGGGYRTLANNHEGVRRRTTSTRSASRRSS